ncbi:MAG: hypothetical protein QG591_173 [Planctomycetota bacterium]|nr:hypothetical protein [Planctomycetota bacterium]
MASKEQNIKIIDHLIGYEMKRPLSIFGTLLIILSIVPICTSQMAFVSENFDMVKLEDVTIKNFAPPGNSGVVESDASYNFINNVNFSNNIVTNNSSLLLTEGSKNIINNVAVSNNIISNGSHSIYTNANRNNISNQVSKEIALNSLSPFVFTVLAILFIITLVFALPKIELLKITLKNQERHGLIAYLFISFGFFAGKYTYLSSWIPENMHFIYWLVIFFIWFVGLYLIWIQESPIRNKIAPLSKFFINL